MKYIVAIIQPDRLDYVLQKLTEKEIHLVTVSTVLGRGRQKGVAEVYRSHKEAGSLLRKVKIEVAVNEDFVKPTVDAIVKGARLENGLLHVDLVREIPEAMKPRSIPIATKSDKPTVIDSKAA